MNDPNMPSDPQPATQMSPEYYASRTQHLALPKSSIERSLNEYFHEIRGTVEGMANDILRLGSPQSGHIITQWDLQQVYIDVTGTVVKHHPSMAAFQEGEPNYDTSQHIYAPVITIQLPRKVLATDKRVIFLRDALLYDESGEFRGPHGIPFRQHPVYSQFTLEFTNPYPSSTTSSRSLWCPSTMAYLPDPNEIFNREHTKLILHDTWDEAGLRDWGSRYKKAKELHESQGELKADEQRSGSTHDGEILVLKK
ncbi:hypothetical protein F4781DRAFT_429894 [Annulohypoxylon bovei var. microspora]|nr:hypothetical protein F4781DRAFT_429894 [Annulohypoxylon bovei var. microspora]